MATLALVASVPAQVLGDRSASLGGAGLARSGDPGRNPAALSPFERAYSLPVPVIQYRAYGSDIGQVTSYLTRLRQQGIDARRFAGLEAPLSSIRDFGGSIGVSYGSFGVSYFGRGIEQITPSSSGVSARALAVEGIQLSYGADVPVARGRLGAGVTARLMSAAYDDKHVPRGSPAKELTPERGAQVATGLALDAGLHYRPSDDLAMGLVVANLVSPRIAFAGAKAGPVLHPFRTSVAAGVSKRLDRSTWVLVDGIDLTNAIDRRQLAVGLERALNGFLSLELGYNTRTSFTLGLTAFGIHARLSGRTPLTVESGIRF